MAAELRAIGVTTSGFSSAGLRKAGCIAVVASLRLDGPLLASRVAKRATHLIGMELDVPCRAAGLDRNIRLDI